MKFVASWKSALFGAALVGASWAGIGGGSRVLTPEQARILDLLSLEQLDDGVGGQRLTIRVNGANLQLVNGTGTTDGAPNGVGNLIVGYESEVELGAPRQRTGSHMVVVGPRHEYTQFGGLVVGHDAFATGEWSTMIGGSHGRASGQEAIVIGHTTHAEGEKAVAVGGAGGRAVGRRSLALGGGSNLAFGEYAITIGGEANTAEANDSVVVGGFLNRTEGENSVVGGGKENTTVAGLSVIVGGLENRTTGGTATISGGRENIAAGNWSTVGGGRLRTADGTSDWVAGTLFEDN